MTERDLMEFAVRSAIILGFLGTIAGAAFANRFLDDFGSTSYRRANHILGALIGAASGISIPLFSMMVGRALFFAVTGR